MYNIKKSFYLQPVSFQFLFMRKHAITFPFIYGDGTLFEKSQSSCISYTHALFTQIKNESILESFPLSLHWSCLHATTSKLLREFSKMWYWKTTLNISKLLYWKTKINIIKMWFWKTALNISKMWYWKTYGVSECQTVFR
jgi:hypothetical protein